jgi:hypothetical protein
MRRVSWSTSLAPPAYARRRNRGGGRAFHHDYVRYGTTTLFAALNILDGTVIGRCMARHRHQELLRFLNAVEAAVPAGKVIHAILDNYGSHRHPKVRAWLSRHPRWTFHFTPTSCSWLNAVEGFFRQADPAPPQTRHLPLPGQPARGHQPLHRAPQPGAQTLRLESRSQRHHCRCQARPSNVADNPLGQD